MSLEYKLLNSTTFESFSNHLNQIQPLQITLEPNFGWEKIKIGSNEEFFNLEKVTKHINFLSRRQNLDEKEISKGREICTTFEGFWTELSDELKTLNCTADIFYKMMHCGRITYFGADPIWIDFWQDRGIMTKASRGIFDADLNLSIKQKR